MNELNLVEGLVITCYFWMCILRIEDIVIFSNQVSVILAKFWKQGTFIGSSPNAVTLAYPGMGKMIGCKVHEGKDFYLIHCYASA